MATTTISLPDPVREWIEDQVAKGDRESPDDLIADLVLHERLRRELRSHEPPFGLDELRAHLAEARASGATGKSGSGVFAEARQAAIERGTLRK